MLAEASARRLAPLEATLERHPGDRDSLLGLINFASRAEGDPGAALRYAEQLAEMEPTNQTVPELIRTLQNEISGQ